MPLMSNSIKDSMNMIDVVDIVVFTTSDVVKIQFYS